MQKKKKKKKKKILTFGHCPLKIISGFYFMTKAQRVLKLENQIK